jgi:hypothetical protein
MKLPRIKLGPRARDGEKIAAAATFFGGWARARVVKFPAAAAAQFFGDYLAAPLLSPPLPPPLLLI